MEELLLLENLENCLISFFSYHIISNSITIFIFRKGNKTHQANYLGITLLSTSLKVLTKIIADDIASFMAIREE